MRLAEGNAQRRDTLMAGDSLTNILLQVGKSFLFIANGSEKNACGTRSRVERWISCLCQIGDRDNNYTLGQSVIDKLIGVGKRTVRSVGAIVTYENL